MYGLNLQYRITAVAAAIAMGRPSNRVGTGDAAPDVNTDIEPHVAMQVAMA